jgi:uncharacterized protein (TIGR00375 family)
MDVGHIACSAKHKGIQVVGTGDFTHPAWLRELKTKLKQDRLGLYDYDGVKFILTAEISNIYTKNGRCRRIHNIIFAPDFKSAEKIQHALAKRGNIASDGRPIFGFDAKDLVKLCLDISENTMVVPAHIWTPWFSVFGSMSGFDSVEECFEEEAVNIHALETGLSADPAMCWRVSALDKYALISNSDAHSPSKLGREANVFDTELSYSAIMQALKTKDAGLFLYTIEFFPEEGKYHYDGHRACNICFAPQETRRYNGLCPVCGKPLTIGVMNRVEQLADRPEGFIPKKAIPFKSLIPLVEIISAVQGKGVPSKAVQTAYRHAINLFGNEYNILLRAGYSELCDKLGAQTADSIICIRKRAVDVLPGYDGVYGRINLPALTGAMPDKIITGELAHAAN